MLQHDWQVAPYNHYVVIPTMVANCFPSPIQGTPGTQFDIYSLHLKWDSFCRSCHESIKHETDSG